jgi:ribose transport system ATP-binding protein
MKNITKRFGATLALDAVDFILEKGEVHALIGENGAGKSTLVKILSGALKQDSGKMYLWDSPYLPSSPLEGRNKGISMIYQELNLAPHLTVRENIMLGREPHKGGFLRRKEMREKVKEVLDFIHHPEISLDIRVKRLSVGARQLVEIARALVNEAGILVMDEPTSSLSQEDSLRLFEIVNRLKKEGVSIIYISHFIEEVQKVADRYTVLRDGRQIHTGSMEEVTVEKLIQMMVGRKFVEMFPRVERSLGEVVVSTAKLKGKTMQAEVDLKLHQGEILGIAGLIGSGRTEMLRTIFGLESIQRGSLTIAEVTSARGTSWSRIEQGLGFLSEDRQGEGLALGRSLADNLTLSNFSPYSQHGFLQLKKQKQAVWDWVKRMKIKARDSNQLVFSLSGGNQQKVALARLLHQKADILLLDEPTRGIDVVSKSQIYELMGRLASQGKAIIFVSSYLPELLGVCDKIAVFHRGGLVDLRPSTQWDAQSIMEAATLGRSDQSESKDLLGQ